MGIVSRPGSGANGFVAPEDQRVDAPPLASFTAAITTVGVSQYTDLRNLLQDRSRKLESRTTRLRNVLQSLRKMLTRGDFAIPDENVWFTKWLDYHVAIEDPINALHPNGRDGIYRLVLAIDVEGEARPLSPVD